MLIQLLDLFEIIYGIEISALTLSVGSGGDC